MKRSDFDADLPRWLVDLLGAGRTLATLTEDDVQACGNSPPHPADCPDCKSQRDAIYAWMLAVHAARKAQKRSSGVSRHREGSRDER
jgi:hypothetical protein